MIPRRVILCAFVAAVSLCAQNTKQFTDVPFVPTPTDVVDAMLNLAQIKPGDVLIDLGSGDGRIVIEAAKRFGIQATGIEIDPGLVQQAQKLANQEGVASKTKFIQGDLFAYDLRPASVVTLFLNPGVNLRLRSKLLLELRPGTRLVSHRFDMGSWTPAKTVQMGDDRIYLWIIPASRTQSPTPVIQPTSAPENPASLFSYDAAAPLEARFDLPQRTSNCSVTTLSYSGAHGPVSATLVTPLRNGKHPAVIFVHDYGRRDEFLPEALLLAGTTLPAASLLIDAPQERPAGWRHAFNALSGDDNDQQIHIQAVIDIRRGIDLLAQRSEVDASRIAYIGHGYGANWGAILSALETRLRAFVLVAGFPSLAQLMQRDDPDMANLRFSLDSRFGRYQESLAAVDPIRFTRSWVGAPILFQFGRFDQFVPRAEAERLAQSFPRAQQVVFYDAGHSLNAPRAMVDRSEFLARWIHSGALRSLHDLIDSDGKQPR